MPGAPDASPVFSPPDLGGQAWVEASSEGAAGGCVHGAPQGRLHRGCTRGWPTPGPLATASTALFLISPRCARTVAPVFSYPIS